MTDLRQETPLATVRIHWGIFITALLVVLLLVVATMPVLFLAKSFTNALTQMTGQLSQQRTASSFNLIWLIILIPDFLIAVGILLATWFSYSKSEVSLTKRRLIFRTGFLSRRSGELSLENVESIFITEPLLGRMLGYGTVMVTSVGGALFPLSYIGSPQSFHSTLRMAVASAKCSRTVSKPPESSAPTNDGDARFRPKV